ncbi:MAG: SUMF1/EgtB/PvdO family nonheme iron enzyme [Planctomycetota bacterium]|nr:SUMF1/EgtB/PvdO family nonheme iron enzyme [Planctomycetota bacterium]
MPETVRIIRVFVSSPGDVQAERDVLDEVVASINRTEGQAHGVRLELFKWKENVTPQIGPKPQQVIDDQTPAYDIYLGIMSTRFGTPTGRYGSGTEKEFKDALKKWKTAGEPWIAFYFDDAPKSLRKRDEIEQYGKVCDFRDDLEHQGIVCGYVGVRGTKDAFFEKTAEHLRQIVHRQAPVRLQNGVPIGGKQAVKPTIPGQYIDWLQRQCGTIELLGLRLKHGSGVRLNQVYTPLSTGDGKLLLHQFAENSLYVSGDPGSGKSTFCRWVAWLACNNGMPSTDVAAPPEYQERFPVSLGGRLPVLIRLRDFWRCLPILPGEQSMTVEEFAEALRKWLAHEAPPGLEWDCLLAHIESGSALLIFDGLDEVPSTWGDERRLCYPRELLIKGVALAMERWGKRWLEEELEVPQTEDERRLFNDLTEAANKRGKRVKEVVEVFESEYENRLLKKLNTVKESWLMPHIEAVIEVLEAGNVRKLRQKNLIPWNRILVTSRPYGLNEDQRRQIGLPHYPIHGLQRPIQDLLVRRWFYRLKEDHDEGLRTASEMVAHIHAERSLDYLTSNPLLLTSMCIIYDEGKRLPQDKYELYDRIVDTVLHKRYPPVKERVSVIRGRLGAVALGMHTGGKQKRIRVNPEAIASDAEIDVFLQTYRQQDGATERGWRELVEVREDLLSQSGLLMSHDHAHAGFYHLSFQEFLAAERLFVLYGGQEGGLLDWMLVRGAAAGWRNTLSFLFGCLVSKFNLQAGVELLNALAARIDGTVHDPTENVALGELFGDCLAILVGRGVNPDTLSNTIEQVLASRANGFLRNATMLRVGHLGDPRIVVDLRDRAAYVEMLANACRMVGDRKTIPTDEAFLLSRFPVTNAQYVLFLEANGYQDPQWWTDDGWKWRCQMNLTAPCYWNDAKWNSPNQPVVGVSWWEADAFAKWACGRLPTEEEWERAACGPDRHDYPWGDEWQNGICNSQETRLERTSPVGIFPLSRSAPFRLEDMAGNVWEWCRDEQSPFRILRGGSWKSGAGGCLIAHRIKHDPRHRSVELGFRVARSLPDA